MPGDNTIDATFLLRAYARARMARLARADPVETQRRVLRRLLGRAAATRFGRDHRFADIRSVEDYQAAVPLRRYEDFWRDYWSGAFPVLQDQTWPGRIGYFAASSGTTSGATKFIPVSPAMLRSNKSAALDILAWHLQAKPDSRLLAGRSFMLGGSTDLVEQAPGVLSGDLSGIAAAEVPWWAQPRYFPPKELALLADWEVKIERLARASLGQDIRSISGTPSWMLLFFAELARQRGDARPILRNYYPDLELVVHGGIAFPPYAAQFEAALAGSHALLREVYAASEGFVAIADRGSGEGMRMVLDHGLFYELVPVEELASERPTRHWLGNAEPGVNYALVLSTCAGLWSYVIGDTVRLLDRDPPRLLITGRTSYSLSAFGEHLIGEELEAAVMAAASGAGVLVTEFSVAARYPERPDEPGRHEFLIELVGEASPEAMAAGIDGHLVRANEDYAAHRQGGLSLAPPLVTLVRPGGFTAWMKARGKLGGQNKVPRVIGDPELLASLRRIGVESPLPGGERETKA